MRELFIGLMSGTSLDGVDAVLVNLGNADPPQVLGAVQLAYPAALKEAVLTACRDGGGQFSTLGRIDIELARLYANAVSQLLALTRVSASEVQAIGSHGQTIHHQPTGDTPFTWQLGDPNTLAVLTGVTVVADFRRRDMALGGQGAPLAPGFHDAVFRHATRTRVVLNCGGIANISVLVPGQDCIGFDTGPANILMDAWVQARRGQPYDAGGAWALQGQVHGALLQRLRADAYFALPPPKSTGREHFNLAWLDAALHVFGHSVSAEDVQCSLLELTAGTVTDAIALYAQEGDLLVAGGGAHNAALLARLAALNPRWNVASTSSLGVAPEHLEAMAFAVFAQRSLQGLPGNLPSVTGASRPCVLGGIYAP